MSKEFNFLPLFAWFVSGVVIGIVMIVIGGCSDNYTDEAELTTYKIYGGYTYEVFVIDSCEYLKGYESLAHKGNCRFCKERNK